MLQYMLAMEFDSEQNPESSEPIYRKLMGGSPPHVDSYFRLAQQKVRQDEIETARGLLRDGIEQARQQGEAHTAAEMSELLQSLGALGE